jgi:Fe2+ transport system protein FeoA
MFKTAKDLKISEKGIIKEINLEDKIQRKRLYDFGFIPNEEISCYAIIANTFAFEVKNSVFAFRNDVAEKIILH